MTAKEVKKNSVDREKRPALFSPFFFMSGYTGYIYEDRKVRNNKKKCNKKQWLI